MAARNLPRIPSSTSQGGIPRFVRNDTMHRSDKFRLAAWTKRGINCTSEGPESESDLNGSAKYLNTRWLALARRYSGALSWQVKCLIIIGKSSCVFSLVRRMNEERYKMFFTD